MISVHFQGKPFNITVIQVYAPNTDFEEAEVDQFYEYLQGPVEPHTHTHTNTHTKGVFFITGDLNAKVGSQETPGMTGKFGLAVQNINRVLSREHAVQSKTLFLQHKKQCYQIFPFQLVYSDEIFLGKIKLHIHNGVLFSH